MSYYVYLSDNRGDIDCYGIAYKTDKGETTVIEDITSDKKSIERLVNVFNSESLDPVHLDQAVEDYLIDFDI